MICISCPRGCELSVQGSSDNLIVTGNHCPKGREFAISETIRPQRFLTTTVSVAPGLGCQRLAVISRDPIDLDRLKDLSLSLKSFCIDHEIELGQEVLRLGDAVLLAASSLKKEKPDER